MESLQNDINNLIIILRERETTGRGKKIFDVLQENKNDLLKAVELINKIKI